ncbi:hypothetical protein HGP14_27860 [Rhizobium sp. P32RR-XVIII]|uniref:hypothetical protein n=1 Tax=Rhizobium sp. P32RR-XVIII TaxID=2726738 RepID=UPI00145696B5|nr:hypothetical protein [Rhizobium sp. P32RR-XVIII]NLS07119.1 hypothetical protein [Rhizobium sp. P32RR-XVIII]
MRDDRWMFIPDPDPKADAGYWSIASWVFACIMIVALVDRGLTIAWHAMQGWWDAAIAFWGFW